jgi:hypothetical protein
LGPVLKKFLNKHPFANAKEMSGHFNISPPTVKEVLRRELGLKRSPRRWVPHELSDDQKKCRADQSGMLLDVLRLNAECNFEGIATGNESWFLCTTYADSVFAASVVEVVPRIERNRSARKTMIATFSTSTRLLALNSLLKGTKFNQGYFIDAVLPDLYSEKTRIVRRKGMPSFSVHMDNLMYHNAGKITEKLGKKHIVRASHPLYSSDLAPCDFC